MKTRHTSFLFAILFVAGIILNFSCTKKYPPMPPRTFATGPAINIAQLKNLWAGMNTKFTSNTILTGVVTMDESSGNIYKQVYIRDNSGTAATNGYGALSIKFLHSTQGFLYQGDSIALNLNGAMLDLSGGGTLELDSVDAYNQIEKLKSGLNPLPLNVTVPQLSSAVFDGHLIKLSGVEFVANEVGLTYAIPQIPPAAPVNINRHLTDSVGNPLVTYNSGYANFAGQVIPLKSGSITGISSIYSSTMQFTIRSFADINFNSNYFMIALDTMNETFPTGLSNNTIAVLPGWLNIAYAGSLQWKATSYGTAPYNHTVPSASSYGGPAGHYDMWLVTPAIKYNANKYMNFTSASEYNTPGYKQLSVLVSSTFDGVNIIPSQWTDLSVLPSDPFYYTGAGIFPNFRWASNNQLGGNAPLVHFSINGNPTYFYVAFRYQGNTTDSTASELFTNLIIRNHP